MSPRTSRILWLLATPFIWVGMAIVMLFVFALSLVLLAVPSFWIPTFHTDPDPPGLTEDSSSEDCLFSYGKV
jgi:hypothetical protein